MTHEDSVWAALGLPDKTPRPASPVRAHVESVTSGPWYFMPVQYRVYSTTTTVVPSITSYTFTLV